MSQSYGPPPPPNQPLSPWAERHGIVLPPGDAVFRRGPVQHSGIAPEHEPGTEGIGTFMHFNDIDRLFLSDDLQKLVNNGVEPWQLGVINKTLRVSAKETIPGGHQKASASPFKGDPETHDGWKSQRLYEDGLIKVQEGSWANFFHKDRWLDWDEKSAVLDGKPWSVDNPLVWDVLKISLELANRVLRAILKEDNPFMRTLLYGHLATWEDTTNFFSPPLDLPEPFENSTVLLSYEKYSEHKDTCNKKISGYMDQIPLVTPEDCAGRIQSLLATQTWSFHHVDGAYGTTHTNQRSTIGINVGILTLLIEGKITLAERCLFQFALAALFLHEMAHSISNFRREETFRENTDEFWHTEPFIDFSGATEMGHRLDMAVWGGVIEFNQRTNAARPHLGFHTLNWPICDHCKDSPRGKFIPGHDDFAAGTIVEKTLISADFASKLLSEEFWNDPEIPRKSENFFHRTNLFISKTPHQHDKPLFSYIEPSVINESLDPTGLTQIEKEMLEDWKKREAAWKTLREGWYDEERKLWKQTPWSMFDIRWALCMFAKGHKEGNIEICSLLADQMADRVPWYTFPTRGPYIANLDFAGTGWIPHAIGFLMMASIPLRGQGTFSPKERNLWGPERLLPSKEAKKAKVPGIALMTERPKGGKLLSASRLVNPFNPNKPGIKFSHILFLDIIHDILEHFAQRGKRISTPWAREILRVEGILRKEHTAREKDAIFVFQSSGAWARSWDFEVPEYRPDLESLWLDGKWVPV
ncbi:hypothetical protein F4803DRAFT_576059 [Xylaria telfairii]|nr:hypothetical protein F4803DRAFT_576059 [Xylaria telfairii]